MRRYSAQHELIEPQLRNSLAQFCHVCLKVNEIPTVSNIGSHKSGSLSNRACYCFQFNMSLWQSIFVLTCVLCLGLAFDITLAKSELTEPESHNNMLVQLLKKVIIKYNIIIKYL